MPSAGVIEFDVLLRGSRLGGAAAGAPELRPRPQDLEACRLWLAQHGVPCEATSFGLACSAPRDVFLALFGSLESPVAPGEIRAMVAQVTFAPPPPIEPTERPGPGRAR